MNNVGPFRRPGVLGDVHAEDVRLETALRFLTQQQAELIVCVGDIVDGPGNVDRCCELLREYQVTSVRGNHERWFLAGTMRFMSEATPVENVTDRTWDYLRHLPVFREIETVSGLLLLCHGIEDHDMGGVRPGNAGDDQQTRMILDKIQTSGEYAFIINGHTHQRMVKSFPPLTIINAGTIFRRHSPCFLLADFAERSAQYYDLTEPETAVSAEFMKF